jgi:hypothetical protein
LLIATTTRPLSVLRFCFGRENVLIEKINKQIKTSSSGDAREKLFDHRRVAPDENLWLAMMPDGKQKIGNF